MARMWHGDGDPPWRPARDSGGSWSTASLPGPWFAHVTGPRLVCRAASVGTISLGTGLSYLADHSICSSEAIYLVRECPLQTGLDRVIGHATGTLAVASSSRSQRAMRFARVIPPAAGPRWGGQRGPAGAGLPPARRTLNQGQARGRSCDRRYVAPLAPVPSRTAQVQAFADSKTISTIGTPLPARNTGQPITNTVKSPRSIT
jgi:hypothetical protein